MATIRKNKTEEVRVTVDEFKGMCLLNLRVWFKADDGAMRPGKQGLAVRVELAEQLADAIRQVAS